MRDHVAAGEREDRLREIFPQLTPAQVGAARSYFLRYRDEIERRIADNAALIPERTARDYHGSTA
jgi:hypothetical protein